VCITKIRHGFITQKDAKNTEKKFNFTKPAIGPAHLIIINLITLFATPIYLWLYGSMALWLYSPCGLWPIFQFLNPYTVCRTPWTREQPVARPVPTRSTTQTQNKRTETPMPEWDSNSRSQRSSKRRQLIP
jgi:hypothetical protein